MQLLVSVRDAREAATAFAGGADVIDAKDPARGALGPVTPATLDAIQAVLAARRPLSAALGDATTAHRVRASVPARTDLAFVKLGFAGKGGASMRSLEHLAHAARDAATTPVILVAYADWEQAVSPEPSTILDVARAIHAAGVLLDTAMKRRRLLEILTAEDLAAWIAAVYGAGLISAIAGGLDEADIAIVRRAGAAIAGVRGAACAVGEGRLGPISELRVARLSALAHETPFSRRPALVEGGAQPAEFVRGEYHRFHSFRERASEITVDQ
ncbi:MAG TPA: (5-formylfuran-3-yl)methyl phosphate synthase [Gemmatimonadales bacterium]|nr:(5-formylfuran-3-yl)methyl phosphate synthase [Gemmatimonadales bacterium]